MKGYVHRVEIAHVVEGLYIDVDPVSIKGFPYFGRNMIANCLFRYAMIAVNIDSRDDRRAVCRQAEAQHGKRERGVAGLHNSDSTMRCSFIEKKFIRN
jgi:hypothetical protein